MARISVEQYKQLLDRGLTEAEIEKIAASRGDTLPSPTLLGTLIKGPATVALRAGQIAGMGIASLLGGDPEKIQKSFEETRVIQNPLLGTIAIPGQRPLNTERGRNQAIGLGLETAGTFLPVGRVGSLAGRFFGKTLGTAAALGASGYGVETGYNLQRGQENSFTPGLGTAIPAAIPIFGKGLSKIPGLFNFAAAKSLGVNSDDIKTILTKPDEFQAGQRSGLSRISLGNMVDEKFRVLSDEVADTGRGYDLLRKGTAQVSIPEGTVAKVLQKYGLQVRDGRIITTAESPALSSGDITALERFLSQFGFEESMSANAFLNARRGLSELADYARDPSRTDQLERISRELRKTYDDIGKKGIPGLKDLDNKYAPVKTELKNLRKEYFQFRDGNWELKDTAFSRIANASNKGREKVLERLEKYVPGITQQIQIVKALEGIGAASGPRAGQYVNAGLLLSGPAAALATGNPIFALLSLLAAVPQIAVPILVAFGKANGIAKDVIRAIAGKLVQGKSFTEKEAMLFRQAIINHLNEISPGDQFISSPLGQRALAYAGDYVKNPRIGLQLRDVTKNSTNKVILRKAIELGNLSKKKSTEVIAGAFNDIRAGGTTTSIIGDKPKAGFAFAPSKATETKIPLERFSQQDVANFFDKWYDTLKQEGHYLGGWVDEGEVVLDVSKVVKNEQVAIKEAIKSNQDAIYDFTTGETKYIKDYKETGGVFKYGGENKTANDTGSNLGTTESRVVEMTEAYSATPSKGLVPDTDRIVIVSSPTNLTIGRQKKLVKTLTPEQQSKYLEYKAKTADVFEEFRGIYDDLVERFSLGKQEFPANRKSDARAIEKAIDDYDGDFTQVKDMNRGALVVSDVSQGKEILDALKSDTQVVKVNNRIETPTPMGYRDIMTKIQLSNGTVGEIQILFRPIEEAKLRLHKYYEESRVLDSISRKRALTQAEQARLAELTRIQKEGYNNAWNQI